MEAYELSKTISTTTAVVDLTKAPSGVRRMAHPGGKLTSNKEKAQAAFLARIRKNGIDSLSTAQRAALRRIEGGAALLHATYGLPSSTSSSSSSTTSSSFSNKNKQRNSKKRQRSSGSFDKKKSRNVYNKNHLNHNNKNNNSNNSNNNYSNYSNHNNNGSSLPKTTRSNRKKRRTETNTFTKKKQIQQPSLTAKLGLSLDDLC
jgi:hypothetical protein